MAIKMTANTLAKTKKFRTRMTYSARLNAAQLPVKNRQVFRQFRQPAIALWITPEALAPMGSTRENLPARP